MNNITSVFERQYTPTKLFAVFEDGHESVFVEAYDMDKRNRPINAHPLSDDEAGELATLLKNSHDLKNDCLKPSGLIPDNVLYLNMETIGFAIWYTLPQTVTVRFVEDLGIADGEASIPALVWKATKQDLYLFALSTAEKPHLKTPLFKAPFFNLYELHRVCMGTVDINAAGSPSLEIFMKRWERYFFDSYFSHLITPTSPVKGNIVQLWKQLVNTKKPFPIKQLIRASLTLNDILL